MKTPLLRLLIVFSVSWLLGSGAMAQVVNGDFETGVLAPFTVTTPDGQAAVTATNNGVPHAGTYFFWGYENTGDGDLSQPLNTVAGASYTISAWVSTTAGGIGINAARLALGSNAPVTCPALTTAYALCTANFVAQTNNDPLHIYFKTVGGSGVVLIDDISINLTQAPTAAQPVPTLGAGLLALLSMLLLIGAAWRVRQPR